MSNLQPRKASPMKHLFAIILMMTLTTSGSMSWGGSDITHPNDLRGFPVLHQGFCTDVETNEGGYCFLIQGHDARYIAFHRPNENALWLRRINHDGTYTVVWHRDTSALVPSGVPL